MPPTKAGPKELGEAAAAKAIAIPEAATAAIEPPNAPPPKGHMLIAIIYLQGSRIEAPNKLTSIFYTQLHRASCFDCLKDPASRSSVSCLGRFQRPRRLHRMLMLPKLVLPAKVALNSSPIVRNNNLLNAGRARNEHRCPWSV